MANTFKKIKKVLQESATGDPKYYSAHQRNASWSADDIHVNIADINDPVVWERLKTFISSCSSSTKDHVSVIRSLRTKLIVAGFDLPVFESEPLNGTHYIKLKRWGETMVQNTDGTITRNEDPIEGGIWICFDISSNYIGMNLLTKSEMDEKIAQSQQVEYPAVSEESNLKRVRKALGR